MQIPLLHPLRKGTRIQEYELNGVLGQGGFGTTYLCRDLNLRKDFALKEYTPHFIADRLTDGSLQPKTDQFRAMFLNGKQDFLIEARKLGKFSHPSIVPVTRFFEANKTAYYMMEYQSGGSLRKAQQARTSSFSENYVRRILAPICDGISELHSLGLIHRDLKPDNIVINDGGNPMIIDFGAASFFQGLSQSTLELISTPGFAPPEQIIPGAPQGPWIDIYALGATFYDLMFSRTPPPAQDRLLGTSFPRAADIGRGLYSTQLLELVDRCLDLDYLKRPQNVQAITQFLAPPSHMLCERIVSGISRKMLAHFLNFANPNSGLRVDELIAFLISFPLIDLAWRIGKDLPTKESLNRLQEGIPKDLALSLRNQLISEGFSNTEADFNCSQYKDKIDEYAAAYLLDRQEENWIFELISRRAAKHCLTEAARGDTEGLSELIGNISDRARSRIKKAFHDELSSFSVDE